MFYINKPFCNNCWDNFISIALAAIGTAMAVAGSAGETTMQVGTSAMRAFLKSTPLLAKTMLQSCLIIVHDYYSWWTIEMFWLYNVCTGFSVRKNSCPVLNF